MIKIIVLLENTKDSPDLKCRHGLSLYAETEAHKILFDMGPDELFLKNAGALGVDIADVAAALAEESSYYYTCHCTGEKAYEKMKTFLGARLAYLRTGAELTKDGAALIKIMK